MASFKEGDLVLVDPEWDQRLIIKEVFRVEGDRIFIRNIGCRIWCDLCYSHSLIKVKEA